jgi:hypothetical protein
MVVGRCCFWRKNGAHTQVQITSAIIRTSTLDCWYKREYRRVSPLYPRPCYVRLLVRQAALSVYVCALSCALRPDLPSYVVLPASDRWESNSNGVTVAFYVQERSAS